MNDENDRDQRDHELREHPWQRYGTIAAAIVTIGAAIISIGVSSGLTSQSVIAVASVSLFAAALTFFVDRRNK